MTASKFINENELDGLILGCTELPLVFPKNKFRNVIDCMEVLSDNLLDNYYNQDSKERKKYVAKN
jgi:aspartate/glutamate racemase